MEKNLKSISVVTFTHLCSQILHRIDKGGTIKVEKISEMAENRTLVSWIEEEFLFDLWKGQDKVIMDDEFERIACISTSDDFGITNNGFCTLARCCILCVERILCDKH